MQAWIELLELLEKEYKPAPSGPDGIPYDGVQALRDYVQKKTDTLRLHEAWKAEKLYYQGSKTPYLWQYYQIAFAMYFCTGSPWTKVLQWLPDTPERTISWIKKSLVGKKR